MGKIYLLASSSYHVINKEIAAIALTNTNITIESLNDTTIYDCIDDASYLGLFNEDRIIIIKDVKYFAGKSNYEEESKAIISFLEHLDESITIIFICDGILKSKDITKSVLKLNGTIIDKSEIGDEEMVGIIASYAESLSITIDAPATNELLNRSLKNIDVAIQEIDKLSNISSHITLDIIKEYGISLDNIDSFEFSNAVVSKNFGKAFDLFDKLLLSGVDEFAILGLLASSYTNMYMVRDAVNHGLTDEEIAKKLGYSGTGRVYVMKKNSKIYTLDELRDIIISLSELDLKLKNGYKAIYEIKEFLLNL